MSLFDLLQSAMGRPDPRQQIAMALGQGQGQRGGPRGPAIGAGGSPAPPAGGPPGGAPGAPQQQQQQQQLPQAYQSPPDLLQMYTALSQRDRSEDQFNRGLALMAASAYPGRRPDLITSSVPQAEDPGQTFRALYGIQQMNYLQAQQQAFMQAVPELAQKYGLPPAAIMATGPEGMRQLVLQEAGVSNDPSIREMAQARKAFVDAHPGDPIPPEYLSVDQFKQAQAGKVVEAQQRQHDLSADRANFPKATLAYDKMIEDAQWLAAPEQQAAREENLGAVNQITHPNIALSPAGQAWYRKYQQVMAEQYAAGVQDFKGAGRISQQELNRDAPSQSTMTSLVQTPENFVTGAKEYIDRLKDHRSQLFGAAGQLNSPDLSDEDYARVNPIYKPADGGGQNGDLYVPGQAARRKAQQQPPSAPDATGGGGGGQRLKSLSDAQKQQARDLIARDGRGPVLQHLQSGGYDTTGL